MIKIISNSLLLCLLVGVVVLPAVSFGVLKISPQSADVLSQSDIRKKYLENLLEEKDKEIETLQKELEKLTKESTKVPKLTKQVKQKPHEWNHK